MDTTKAANGGTSILQVCVTPSCGALATSMPDWAPFQKAFVSTSEFALRWMEKEIMHIQCEGDDRRKEHLRGATACFQGAKFEWPLVSTARYGEFNMIYKLLQVRRGPTRDRLGQVNDRVKGLAGARLQAYERHGTAPMSSPASPERGEWPRNSPPGIRTLHVYRNAVDQN